MPASRPPGQPLETSNFFKKNGEFTGVGTNKTQLRERKTQENAPSPGIMKMCTKIILYVALFACGFLLLLVRPCAKISNVIGVR